MTDIWTESTDIHVRVTITTHVYLASNSNEAESSLGRIPAGPNARQADQLGRKVSGPATHVKRTGF